MPYYIGSYRSSTSDYATPAAGLPTKPAPPVTQSSSKSQGAEPDRVHSFQYILDDWELKGVSFSPGSYESGGGKPTADEIKICALMNADGYEYNVNSSTSSKTINRVDCKDKDCTVQTKICRGNGMLARYQRGEHNHIRPSRTSGVADIKPNSIIYQDVSEGVASRDLPHARSRFPASDSKPPAKKAALFVNSQGNRGIAFALNIYAKRLQRRNLSLGIDGDATHVPNTIRRAANSVREVSSKSQVWLFGISLQNRKEAISHLSSIMQAEYVIERHHYPFSENVCTCTIDGWSKGRKYEPTCSERGPIKDRRCSRGDYNIKNVGPVIANLIDDYFENQGDIPTP